MKITVEYNGQSKNRFFENKTTLAAILTNEEYDALSQGAVFAMDGNDLLQPSSVIAQETTIQLINCGQEKLTSDFQP